MKKKKFYICLTQVGKIWIALCSMALFMPHAHADTLSLRECRRLAWENFNHEENKNLRREIAGLKISELQRRWAPSLQLKGQAAYQSDVFEIPFSPPGIELPELPREKYQAYLEVQQIVYDGGALRSLKNIEQNQLNIALAEDEVDRRDLTRQVDAVYFRNLLLQRTAEILENAAELLNRKYESMTAALAGGVVLESDVLKIKAEIINMEKQTLENREQLQAAREALEILTGISIGDEAQFGFPDAADEFPANEVRRPEIQLISEQQNALTAQISLVSAQYMPKLNLFGSGGAGYPNPYDFYDIDLSPYYIFGAQLSWKLWDWKQAALQKQSFRVQSSILENKRENLDKTISIQLQQYQSDIDKYQKILAKEQELVETRQRIREIASRQLDEGVITSTDYLDDVNAEKNAKLNLEINRIRLMQSKINYLTESGRF